MAFKCTCGIEHPDVVTKDEHTRRIAAKEEANKQLRESLVAAEAKAKDADEVGTLRTKLAELTEAGARSAAFTEHGIGDAVRRRFEVLYASDTAELEADKRPPFADWLKLDTTKADPVLMPHYGKAGKPGEATTTQPAAAKAGEGVAANNGRQPATASTASTEAGAGNAGKDGIKTPQDLDAFLRSPAYRNMPIADQRKFDAEMAGKLGISV
jgi:hypothetical protein